MVYVVVVEKIFILTKYKKKKKKKNNFTGNRLVLVLFPLNMLKYGNKNDQSINGQNKTHMYM